MGEELTHLVGGGILVILVLDRVANLLKLFLDKKNGTGSADTTPSTTPNLDALTHAITTGFAESREDNKQIREHLHSIANTLGGLVTGVAVIRDRGRGV